ncbi:MAG: hypothetical protein AB7O97_19305 [Planctomycetota bacterium]
MTELCAESPVRRWARGAGLLLVFPWLGGCYLTQIVWQDFGAETRVEEPRVANYRVDRVATGVDDLGAPTLLLHAVQQDGAVAEHLRAQCGPDAWIRLCAVADADVALALWRHPAFAVEVADFVVEVHGDGLGETWTGSLLLSVRCRDDALGVVLAPPGTLQPDEPSPEDPLLVDSLQRCGRDLAAADWSRVTGRALDRDRGAEVVAWQRAADAPFRHPAPAANGAIDAAASLRRWPDRLQDLEGAVVTLRCTDTAGRPVLLQLDATAAWLLARSGGAPGTMLHRSSWRAAPAAAAADDAGAQRLEAPARLVLHTVDYRLERGETVGTFLLRVLATPFAMAGDIASAWLVGALSDDDDDDAQPAAQRRQR